MLRASKGGCHERQAALSELMTQNWYPLYTFLRRSGRPVEEIEDLIQGFYLRILEKDLLAGIEQRQKGRFRNFLLVCLKNYVTNQWHHDRSAKRGGDSKTLSLDLESAHRRYQFEPSHDLTPQRAFDHAWAVDMIDRSLKTVAARWQEAGKGERFDLLKGYLTQIDPLPRSELAKQLGISTNSLKVMVHRLRAEFRRALCEQVADTLDRDDLLEDEINLLFSKLRM